MNKNIKQITPEIIEWCECCGAKFTAYRAFCPSCGAKLIEEKTDNDL